MIYDENTIAAKYLIKTSYVVRVLEVSPEDQTVTVIQDSLEFASDADGDYVIRNEYGVAVRAAPLVPFIVSRIPVQQLRWGKFSIQCMPQVGDTGLLVVFTDDIQRWIEEGSASAAGSGDKFSVDSAIFIPFMANLTNSTPDYPEPDTKLIIKGESVSIEIVDDGETAAINVTGNTSITGSTSITGDVSIDGGLSVTGKITSDDDIVADNISLKDHTHTIPSGTALVDPQTGMTTAPVQIPKPDEPTGV